MTSRLLPALLAISILASVSCRVEAQQDTKSIVNAELTRINVATNQHINATFATSGGSDVDSAGNVVIDTTQLETIRSKTNVKQFQDVVSLILAHEVSHLMQFQAYGLSKVENSFGETRQIFEAQADLLAGQYLAMNFDPNAPVTAEAIEDALNVMYYLGVAVGARYADHPSQNQRLTAVRLGMASGTMLNMHAVSQRPGADPHFADAVRILSQKLDFSLTEADIEWSLTEAVKIMQAQTAYSQSLKVSQPILQWHLEDAVPSVSYSIGYTNGGAVPLTLDMDVQCWTAPANNPNDLKHSQLWASANYKFTLAPAEQHIITGRLEFQKSNTLKPRLVWPTSADSMFMVTN